MKKVVAEKYRDIDFSRARRGAVVKVEPGKAKISIRLDNAVLELSGARGQGRWGELPDAHQRRLARAHSPTFDSRLRSAGSPGGTCSIRHPPRVQHRAAADAPSAPLSDHHAASAAPIRSTKLSQ